MMTVRRIALCPLVLAGWLLVLPLVARSEPSPIPQAALAELQASLDAHREESSTARKRLAVKRTIRAGETLIEAHPDAANRFLVMGILFKAQQGLLALDSSPETRTAMIETCRKLSQAPEEYADIRLDADILLSQAEAARQGADGQARMNALKPLLTRYRDTPAEGRIMRIAMLMALEVGDQPLIDELRETMEIRFASDLGLIEFMREKLGGQVFGAPFCGVFETADGQPVRFPMDGLGRTTLVYFWSKEDGGEEDLTGLAAAWNEIGQELEGRIQILSVNLDDLPDAGASILRAAGVDWPAIRLPGGRESAVYRAYGRSDPKFVTVSPTGYAALIMSGSTRKSSGAAGLPDYARSLRSSLAREWTEPHYLAQLVSLLAGELFVMDATKEFDPTRPPELVALAAGDEAIPRPSARVPEQTLHEIQQCFTPPPLRYRLPLAEARGNYERAADLCRKAITAHPDAPDLWIVRNRLIVSLLGLWKVTADNAYLNDAISESKAAIEGGSPPGTELVPRMCLAREALHAGKQDPNAVIAEFVRSMGGQDAPGPALAAAAILALEVGARGTYEHYRQAILEKHTENPMMWTAVSYLLDRYHQYHLFWAPFTSGWTPGRRTSHFLSEGESEDAHRLLEAELKSLDGGTFRIPEDARGRWTAVIFTAPWKKDGLPRSPEGLARKLSAFAGGRPAGDVNVLVAVLDDDADKVRSLVAEKPLPCPVMMVPGGMKNILVHRLGILAEDESANALLLRPDGSIAVTLSGLTMRRKGSDDTIPNVIERHDELAIVAALERGDIEEAKKVVSQLVPPFDRKSKDSRGRPLKKPSVSPTQLRSRARVFMAVGDWANALADAEALVEQELGRSGGLSMRTEALDEAEQLRDQILQKQPPVK